MTSQHLKLECFFHFDLLRRCRFDLLERTRKKAARLMGLKDIPAMKIQKRRRGRAHIWDGYFTIPEWAALKAHPAYAIAYVIHELTHFRQPVAIIGLNKWRCRNHGADFRRVESETAEAFGLRLVYRGRAYLEEIRCLETGRIICERHGMAYVNERECEHPACLI